MSEPATNLILVFDSIHHVLAAERAFQQGGVWCDLTPTPRAILADCGMVVEFRTADADRVGQLLHSLLRQPRGVYEHCQGNYRAIQIGAARMIDEPMLTRSVSEG